MATLQLNQVVKSFDTTKVIHGVDLAVADGEFVVFVGPSGCGKSTLLRLICGLEGVTSGDVMIDGQRVNDVSAADRGLAMVFQSYALYPHMTVEQNMTFGLENIGTERSVIESKLKSAAKLLQLDTLLQRKPTQLSGGQRQRVAIGRAIVREPKIFLFDEPLSNLDAELRVSMRGEITALHRRLGATMIYVTHDQVEAMTMGDRIAVFNKGVVEQLGAPMDLYNRPANEFVAGFIGAPRINMVDRPADGAPAAHRTLWNTLAANAPAGVRRVGLRPEHFRVVAAGQGVPAHVELAEHLGDVSILHLRVDGVAELLSAKVGAGHTSVDTGQAVGLEPDASWAMAFGADARLAA